MLCSSAKIQILISGRSSLLDLDLYGNHGCMPSWMRWLDTETLQLQAAQPDSGLDLDLDLS